MQDTATQLQVNLVDVPTNNWTLVANELFGNNAPGNEDAILPSLVPKSFYAGEYTTVRLIQASNHYIKLDWPGHRGRALCTLQAW